MGKVQANTRLDQDTADTLEQHCDEMDMTKAEVLRRATRNYLDEHAEQDGDDSDEETERRVMADGSGVTESVLKGTASLLGAFTLVPSMVYTLLFLGLVEFPVFSLDQLHTASMSGFFAFLLCYGLLQTGFAERVDRALYTRARSVRNVVSPGGD